MFINTNRKKRIFLHPGVGLQPQIQTGIFTVKLEKNGLIGYPVFPLPVLIKRILQVKGGFILLKPDGYVWVVSKSFLEDVRPNVFFKSEYFSL